MARYENALSTLEARTLADMVKKYDSFDFIGRCSIEDGAIDIVQQALDYFPEVFEEEKRRAYMAFTLSSCARKGVASGSLPVLEYISIFAESKRENFEILHDFGAFGDLLEILVRCAFLKKKELVTASALYVKDIKTVDIKSKRYGQIEVGHNGKTLSFGTCFDFMAGDYNSVVYGVFSDEDKEYIYKLCKEEEYNKAIDNVTSYMSIWDNKYKFQSDMDNLTRGKGITIKGGSIQVVYNPGKYKAFLNALEEGTFNSLYDILGRG